MVLVLFSDVLASVDTKKLYLIPEDDPGRLMKNLLVHNQGNISFGPL
jgi:hypothetical protein